MQHRQVEMKARDRLIGTELSTRRAPLQRVARAWSTLALQRLNMCGRHEQVAPTISLGESLPATLCEKQRARGLWLRVGQHTARTTQSAWCGRCMQAQAARHSEDHRDQHGGHEHVAHWPRQPDD